MEKVKVTICTGTACFVMGASELMLLQEKLPEDLSSMVEIVGSMCMNECRGEHAMQPPFVKIDDEIVSSANVPETIEKIRQAVERKRA